MWQASEDKPSLTHTYRISRNQFRVLQAFPLSSLLAAVDEVPSGEGHTDKGDTDSHEELKCPEADVLAGESGRIGREAHDWRTHECLRLVRTFSDTCRRSCDLQR